MTADETQEPVQWIVTERDCACVGASKICVDTRAGSHAPIERALPSQIIPESQTPPPPTIAVPAGAASRKKAPLGPCPLVPKAACEAALQFLIWHEDAALPLS